MGIHIIKMPDIGEGIAEVELAQWHVKPGDRVTEDQVLVEVMTDKATVEVPSPVIGTVIALGGKAGDVMAVGSELIRIEIADDMSEPSHGVGTVPKTSEAMVVAPLAGAMADKSRSGDVMESVAATVVGTVSGMLPMNQRPLASPSVRRHARQLGLDLRAVQGSGPSGRIRHQDLSASVENQAGSGNAPIAAAGYAERHDENQVPVIGLRRKIAQRMQEAKRHIPHFT
ncbi:MAG: biotin/lipoyl-containing protein, partial [Paralcaligenes sp.]